MVVKTVVVKAVVVKAVVMKAVVVMVMKTTQERGRTRVR